MKLSPAQIEWINREQEILVRLDLADPDHKRKGWLADRLKLANLQIIIDLHNLELKMEKANDKKSV